MKKKLKILCHVAPWCLDQFSFIARGFDEEADVRFVSGFKNLDQTGLVSSYYRYVTTSFSELSIDQRDYEVIERCRLMRLLPKKIAFRHVAAMRLSIRETLIRENPDIVICESIDQFLHDLLFQEAESLSIPSYGLIRSFVNNYFRVSTRGEMNISRIPGDGEVAKILSNLLDESYLPRNLVKLKKSQFLTYLKIYFSNHARVVYFKILRYLKNEPFNYHYWSSSEGTKESYAHLLPMISLGDKAWKLKLKNTSLPVIFIPLQHFPEATIDYWAEDIEMVNYPERLIEFIVSLSVNFQILIKEHPGVWGYRKPEFYKIIQAKVKNVIFCPSHISSQECILNSDSVLVWTGSVGFEAALRGKPVLTTCTPYYASGNRFKKITTKTGVDEINQFINQCNKTEISLEEQNNLIHYLLSGLMPGHFQNNGTFNGLNKNDVANAINIGSQIRNMYEKRNIKTQN